MSSRKACTSCGAVSTPQWREGPYGPRTLCNACGVRHLRRDNGRPSDRKAQAKLVRRKAHAAPAVKDNKATFTKVKTKINKNQKQHGSYVQSCSDRLKEQSQPSQQSVQDWYQESASLSDAQHPSHPSIEDNAAANLVAMSKPHMFTDDMSANCNGACNPAKDAAYPYAEEHASDSEPQACEQLGSTEAELQAQFLTDMAAMREEVEAAEKKLSAANAAVDAVSQVLQVLAAKQAAVIAAWAVMVDANQRLQQHMKQEPNFHEIHPCKRVKMF